MARNTYQTRLTELEEDVLYLSELVAERVRFALDALEDKDTDKAQEVIQGDHEINQLYLDLEKDCIDLLALQQPVAGDLRFITASFKIITDLERIGDLATNLAGYAIDAEKDVYPEVDIRRIGDAALDMVDQAMDAYESEDSDLCRSVAERDDNIDEMCSNASQTVVRDLMTGSDFEGDGDLEPEEFLVDVRRLLLTIRDLERIGDHAVNVAARTLYMIDNDDSLLF
ncbi:MULTISPECIES: phosphate signaling complex protein PhoU [Haloferax]|uniref:Phosphate-specific transport system accessory protein PhoU n=1 Tax=Haloferax marinum TaxID=2666143 RepID=A0A6A8GB77_9EURY|nr:MULTISPECIES: phosphate signaling complex protein PhoU [Haloferax]KAB1198392.1 phosphate signaling complex protein PhoU [Haloferax sp. CBA1150]MRW97493.1 phosphate signaling complex protein PhoU [Haloferax marinum]